MINNSLVESIYDIDDISFDQHLLNHTSRQLNDDLINENKSYNDTNDKIRKLSNDFYNKSQNIINDINNNKKKFMNKSIQTVTEMQYVLRENISIQKDNDNLKNNNIIKKLLNKDTMMDKDDLISIIYKLLDENDRLNNVNKKLLNKILDTNALIYPNNIRKIKLTM